MSKAKKGIRERRQDYIKRDIRELTKLGFDKATILKDKAIESIAWTQKSYDNYRKHIRTLKRQLKQGYLHKNQHGRIFSSKEYKQIMNVTKILNTKKKVEFEKYKREQPNMDSVEKAFLLGQEVTTKTSSEMLKLANNFGNEDIFNSIGKDDDLTDMLDYYEDKANRFTKEQVVDNGYWFDRLVLNDFYKYGKINEDEYEVLLDVYKELPATVKMHIKHNIETLMQQVESATTTKYKNDYYRAIKTIMLTNIHRKFILN